jgi:hypothetical protein
MSFDHKSKALIFFFFFFGLCFQLVLGWRQIGDRLENKEEKQIAWYGGSHL